MQLFPWVRLFYARRARKAALLGDMRVGHGSILSWGCAHIDAPIHRAAKSPALHHHALLACDAHAYGAKLGPMNRNTCFSF